MPQTRALLISIGENPESVIYSINDLKPECLCFFASEDTRHVINDIILPQLQERPASWMAEIITADSNDLLTCYRSITAKWAELQKNWRLEPGDWVVDYTAGTKPMTAAIILAAIDYSSGLRYVSSSDITKESRQVNPWDELAVKERQEAAVLFRRGRYSQSADIFRDLTQRVSGGEKQLYKVLAEIADGYALWDSFQYKQAWERLKPSQKALEMATLFGGPPGVQSLVTRLKNNLGVLEKLALGMPGIRQEHFLDILSNAKRRAELEYKYDDAIARLYRALEAYAQIRLASHNVDISHAMNEQEPVITAFAMLEKAGDSAGKTFSDNLPQIKLLLDSRNKSILAHGFEPVKRERYEELYKLILKISSLGEEAIPKFIEITV